ncbi:hypothetical protein AVEN_198000-1 [Araneus ventricosus]|uniref:DDE Tnp4 domain-containing protein n=1 Tax=Araneus ventricosus TaxID=182803 RepID=A0A4Y2I4E9_ARAVE|nr:hypothetical protein AVEN_198000-1 [Araneus ventricosus]
MEGDSNPTIGRIGGPIQIGIYEDESIQQRRSEPTAQRRGSKTSPEQSCSGVTDVELPQNLLPPKKISDGENEYLSNPGYQKGISTELGVSKATVSRTVNAVVDSIIAHANEWIKLPTTNSEITKPKQLWPRKYNFATAIGAIDCSNIGILKPKLYGDEFINQKGKPTLNVQAPCDAKEMFTSVDVSWPGSMRDSRIWKNSQVCLQLRNKGNAVLIGDNVVPTTMPVVKQRDTNEDCAKTLASTENKLAEDANTSFIEEKSVRRPPKQGVKRVNMDLLPTKATQLKKRKKITSLTIKEIFQIAIVLNESVIVTVQYLDPSCFIRCRIIVLLLL